jgi:hypothetical protein
VDVAQAIAELCVNSVNTGKGRNVSDVVNEHTGITI